MLFSLSANSRCKRLASDEIPRHLSAFVRPTPYIKWLEPYHFGIFGRDRSETTFLYRAGSNMPTRPPKLMTDQISVDERGRRIVLMKSMGYLC